MILAAFLRFFSLGGRLGVVCVTLTVVQPCVAAFVVLDGNVPEPGEENILLGGNTVGSLIMGTTNQSGATVLFQSPSQFLLVPASGQARIEALVSNDINSGQLAIDDSITVSLASSNLSFGDLIFNSFIGGGLGAGGSLTVVVNGFDSNNGPLSQTFTLDDDGDPLSLGNGSNFYTVLASGGDRMTSVEISPNIGSTYADLRQIRISQIAPEPGSMVLMLLGFVFVLTRRRSMLM